ncbi:dihydrofolate reductase family protein [Thalassotalea maritima]|uniref:dihydrofolate reductase family protein n=1 Tax=Thalassotalea maritima TaxID=3242416 RepID=UPI00352810F2
MSNIVFIATSLDGYIADKNNDIQWLNNIDNPNGDDMGFAAHMEKVDAIVMGRNTFELVASFAGQWPYTKKVFVLSNSLTELAPRFNDKAELIHGSVKNIVSTLHKRGYKNLYIDGGNTIQQFLADDLIDEMIITTIPILLGGGIALFADLATPLTFKHIKADRYLDAIIQNHYRRVR